MGKQVQPGEMNAVTDYSIIIQNFALFYYYLCG